MNSFPDLKDGEYYFVAVACSFEGEYNDESSHNILCQFHRVMGDFVGSGAGWGHAMSRCMTGHSFHVAFSSWCASGHGGFCGFVYEEFYYYLYQTQNLNTNYHTLLRHGPANQEIPSFCGCCYNRSRVNSISNQFLGGNR